MIDGRLGEAADGFARCEARFRRLDAPRELVYSLTFHPGDAQAAGGTHRRRGAEVAARID